MRTKKKKLKRRKKLKESDLGVGIWKGPTVNFDTLSEARFVRENMIQQGLTGEQFRHTLEDLERIITVLSSPCSDQLTA